MFFSSCLAVIYWSRTRISVYLDVSVSGGAGQFLYPTMSTRVSGGAGHELVLAFALYNLCAERGINFTAGFLNGFV